MTKATENTQVATMEQWEQELAAAAKQEYDTEAGGSTTISLRGKTFHMGDVDLGEEIDVVIGATAFEHAYYDADYDPDNRQPPACFAIGQVEGELAPHPNSPAPQAESCKDCPHNQFGSAERGKGKRCRNSRRLAVYAYGKEGLSVEEVPVIRLAPTSLKNYAKYVKSVSSKFKRPTYAVVTTLGFDKKDTYPKVTEEFKSLITSPDEMSAIMNNREAAFAAVNEPYDTTSYSGDGTVPEATKKSKMS